VFTAKKGCRQGPHFGSGILVGYEGGEPCKFVDSPSRFIKLYGRLYSSMAIASIRNVGENSRENVYKYYSKNAVYRALFFYLGLQYEISKSKKLPEKSKFYKVPDKHDA
jgi:hypothetical protein